MQTQKKNRKGGQEKNKIQMKEDKKYPKKKKKRIKIKEHTQTNERRQKNKKKKTKTKPNLRNTHK